MDITQARGLLNGIETLLYSSSEIEHFLRSVFNEIPSKVVDERFIEALAKINALGAFDTELNNFINVFVRSQIKKYYDQLYRTRSWHLIHEHVYAYSDVLQFVNETRSLIQLLRKKIEQIHTESCKVAEEFSKHIVVIACGTGVLIVESNLS
jgi:hypothetical protein